MGASVAEGAYGVPGGPRLPHAFAPATSRDSLDRYSITNTSALSTNYTMSNLPGAGRVLGNLYSIAGRRLERTVGSFAHRAGIGPNATYEKIRELASGEWRGDDNKSKLQKIYVAYLPN